MTTDCSLLLVVAAMNIGVKSTGPGVEGELSLFLADVGRYFLMVPLGALLVAEAVLATLPPWTQARSRSASSAA